MTEAEFTRRFTERLIARVGEHDSRGMSVRAYGESLGPVYYKDHFISGEDADDSDDDEGAPEFWADCDLEEWEYE